jgi:hypothetical protein
MHLPRLYDNIYKFIDDQISTCSLHQAPARLVLPLLLNPSEDGFSFSTSTLMDFDFDFEASAFRLTPCFGFSAIPMSLVDPRFLDTWSSN